MKKTIAVVLCISIAGLLWSCAEMDSAQTGALIGAAAGGVLGSKLSKDDPELGAAIGAAAGALAGAVIGKYLDRKLKSAQDTAKTYQYEPSQGTMVQVEDVRMEPSMIRPGQKAKLVINYALLNSDPNKVVPVMETRQILSDGKSVKKIGPMSKNRNAGTYVTEQEVTFPQNIPSAMYTLNGSVEAGGRTSSKQAGFRVSAVQGDQGVVYALVKVR
jgi:outer membrane lipoprotein SlyB